MPNHFKSDVSLAVHDFDINIFFLSRAVFNYLLFKGLARPLNDGMTKGTARFSRTHELYSKRQQHNDQRKSDSRLFIRPVEMCNTENVGSLYHFD